ncbi:MAG: hypothetical protein WC374_13005 [Phycisphaerae bacterium]|jgi:hypothetical protein
MKEKFAALLNVKTIVTFVVTFVFAVLSLRGDVKPDTSMVLIMTVIGFYFGTQKQKADTEK